MAISALAEGPPQPRIIHAIDRYPFVLWRETWAGGEVLARSWSVYTGSTVALTGDIEGVGWRMRSVGGYGQYTYDKAVRGPDGLEPAKMTGRKAFSDVLLGYHSQWHGLTLKAFFGMTSEQHFIDPRDIETSDADFSYGAKAALETWLSISDHHWVAANIALASSHKTYKLGLKTGYRIVEGLDLGIEARIEGNDIYTAARTGAFATLSFGDAGFTASAGVTGDRDMRSSHYASVNFFLRY